MWVTPCCVICSGANRFSSGAITTLKPRVSVQKSSSTEISNEMLVTASHTPGSVPSTRSIPVKKFTTLRCVTITPLGLPVEPEV